MLVLMCGGIKTINIIKAIKPQFKKGGVNFKIINLITGEEIKNYLSKGAPLDKAIIIEQSWTDDWKIQDEKEIRKIISNFKEQIKPRIDSGAAVVFITSTPAMAAIVHEETIDISKDIRIVVKEYPYTASFFSTIVASDIDNIPDNYIFNYSEYLKSKANDTQGFKQVLKHVEDIEPTVESPEDQPQNGSLEDVLFSDYQDLEDLKFSKEISVSGGIQIDQDNNIDDEPIEKSTNGGLYEIEKGKKEISGLFSDEIYEKENEDDGGYTDNDTGSFDITEDEKTGIKFNTPTTDGGTLETQIIGLLSALKGRGISLVITGAEGSGKSFIAANIANIISKLGFMTLLVDLDTQGRAQAYLNKEFFEVVHSGDTAKNNLLGALNSGRVGQYVDIISPGLHVITNGLAGDIVNLEKQTTEHKIGRFDSAAKNNYNVIIYDVPFNIAIGVGSSLINMGDNIIICLEPTNWGVMKMLLYMTNVEELETQGALFNRGMLCLNKVMNVKKIFYKSVKDARGMLKSMDNLILKLIGIEPEFRFRDMYICGSIGYDPTVEQYWFNKKMYSDSEKGYETILKITHKILLKE